MNWFRNFHEFLKNFILKNAILTYLHNFFHPGVNTNIVQFDELFWKKT